MCDCLAVAAIRALDRATRPAYNARKGYWVNTFYTIQNITVGRTTQVKKFEVDGPCCLKGY